MEANNDAVLQSVITEREEANQARLEASLRAGANWFLWIAAISIINTVIILGQGNFRFVFGLGITSFVDEVGVALGAGGGGLAIIVNGLITGVFALFGVFARKGRKWAFYMGMSFYALDALLALVSGEILSVAFHAWAFFGILRGLKALSQLAASEVQEPAAVALRQAA